MQTVSSKKTVNLSPHNLSHAHSEESFILLVWKACGSLRTCDRGQVRPLKNIFFKVWYPNSRLSFLSKCILKKISLLKVKVLDRNMSAHSSLHCWTTACIYNLCFQASTLSAALQSVPPMSPMAKLSHQLCVHLPPTFAPFMSCMKINLLKLWLSIYLFFSPAICGWKPHLFRPLHPTVGI